jgi:predicted AlkP superfamily pyrophosphatase or phosphodiesterase
VIIVAFIALLFGAWKASHGKHRAEKPEGDHQNQPKPGEAAPDKQSSYVPQHLSNGTHMFAPTTVLISLDGFRADFLFRDLTPTLKAFAKSGVSPKYMLPSFPSLTFPNHFTLVTGLHPESHGIVGNSFWDPETEKEFWYTDPDRSMKPEWWDAEPVWVTAERAGVRAAIHMWPGSEAHIGGIEPAYVDEFNDHEPLDNKVNRILGWLDQPGLQDESTPTPQLIAAYVPNVDVDGHKYGPNSTYIRSTIAKVDGMLAQLLRGVDDRNLTDIVNIIVVSDHGMATVAHSRLMQLEDIVDTSLIEHTDGWPLYGLRPYDTTDAKLIELYNHLYAKSKTPKYNGLFDVYLRDQNMPERYHFSQNIRIAPLWLVPKPGWAIVTQDEYDVAQSKGINWELHGLHGYDNQHPLMRAIFVARGPAFPHVAGSALEPFQNTEVYNIVCDSLGIKPVPNNGTVRLPLKPSGKHDFDQPPDVPEDTQEEDWALPPEVPNLNYRPGQEGEHKLPPELENLANRPDFMVPTEGVPPVEPTPPSTPPPETPDEPDAYDGKNDEKKGPKSHWWDWMNAKIEAIKGWAAGIFGSKKPAGGDDLGEEHR